MNFFKGEQSNNNEDIIEEDISEDKKEEIKTDQDPGLGHILTDDEVFKTRKHLSELIDKASKKEKEKENDKEELLKIKEEINEIIGNKKE